MMNNNTRQINAAVTDIYRRLNDLEKLILSASKNKTQSLNRDIYLRDARIKTSRVHEKINKVTRTLKDLSK